MRPLCATRSLCLALTGLYRHRVPAALIRKADVIVSERIGSRCGALETYSAGLRHTHVFQLALWCSLAWIVAAGDTLGCLTVAADTSVRAVTYTCHSSRFGVHGTCTTCVSSHVRWTRSASRVSRPCAHLCPPDGVSVAYFTSQT